MKTRRFGFVAAFVILPTFAVTGAIALAQTYQTWQTLQVFSLTIGSAGAGINNSYRACDSGTAIGSISAASVATSTTTVAGAVAGDGCLMEDNGASPVSNAIAINCAVTAANTVTAYYKNASAGALTPPAAVRCYRTFSP